MSAQSSSPSPSASPSHSPARDVSLPSESGSDSTESSSSSLLTSVVKAVAKPSSQKYLLPPGRLSPPIEKDARSSSISYAAGEESPNTLQLPSLSKRNPASPASFGSLPYSSSGLAFPIPPPPHAPPPDVSQRAAALWNSTVTEDSILDDFSTVEGLKTHPMGRERPTTESLPSQAHLSSAMPFPSPSKGIEVFGPLKPLNMKEDTPPTTLLTVDSMSRMPESIGGGTRRREKDALVPAGSPDPLSTDSLSMAVVPFSSSSLSSHQAALHPLPSPYSVKHHTPKAHSSSGRPHHTCNSSMSSRSPSTPHIVPYVRHVVQVCPTCHRPFDTSFAPPRLPEAPKKFTPHYFRQLTIAGPTPLLAIMDVPHDDSLVSEGSSSGGSLVVAGRNTNRPLLPPSRENRGVTSPPSLSTSSRSSKPHPPVAMLGSDSSPSIRSKLLIPAGPLSSLELPSSSASTSASNTTPRAFNRGGRQKRRSRSFNKENDHDRSGLHRSPPHTASMDVHPSMYTYVSPTVLQEGSRSPTGSSGEGGRPPQDGTDMFMDRELWELLAAHQAKLRGATTSALIVEDQGQHHRESRVKGQKEGEEDRSFFTPAPPPHPPSTYYEKYFLEAKKLGSGTFGGVYLCMHVMEGVPLGTFALKKIPVGDDILYLQNVLKEVRILEEVKRHPNVIEYNHSWVDEAKVADFGPSVRCLFILMEYANEGSLESYLERHSTVLSTMAVWYFFLSAVAGTAHLHQKNILHRDLKPQNLLLSALGPNTLPRVLVSDFGTAALLGESTATRTGGTGTLEYMAPELFERDLSAPPDQEKYMYSHTKSSDVWSLGLILHYLACATALPKRGKNGYVILDIPSLSPVPRPPEMIELIRAMVQLDPKKRPSCHDIMRSTVVQTLLYSFNNVPFTAMDLFSPLYESPSYSLPHSVPTTYSPREEDTDNDDETEGTRTPAEVVSSPLESSRVELLSTIISATPLIQQYQNQEMRTAIQSNGSFASNANVVSPACQSPVSPGVFWASDPSSAFPNSAKTSPPPQLGQRAQSGIVTPYSATRRGFKTPTNMNINQLVIPSRKQLFSTKTREMGVQTDPVIIVEKGD